MNTAKGIFSFLCLFVSLFCGGLAAEPIRVFYDTGPSTYEVSQFKNIIPVLDTPLDSDVERFRFGGKWSYSGELPLDPEFMSMVYPYRVRKEPEIYSNRELPPAYYVQLHSGFSNSLAWKAHGKKSYLALFGWLVDDELKGVWVANPKAFTRLSGFLKLEGEGIEPDGVLVAWAID